MSEIVENARRSRQRKSATRVPEPDLSGSDENDKDASSVEFQGDNLNWMESSPTETNGGQESAQGDNTDVDMEESEGGTPQQPTKQRRGRPKGSTKSTSPSETRKRSRQQVVKEDGDSDGESDFDPDSDEAEQTPKRSRRKRTQRISSPKGGVARGPVEERTCPHCKKVVSTKVALKYHIENYVCRIDKCTDEALIAKASRKRGKSKKGGAASKRFRGALTDRTCPTCNRVFTSTLGLKYHVKHKVCQQPTSAKKEEMSPFHVLQPGERFVTMFGVVEVVKDDRATPTAKAPTNVKSMTRTFQSSKGKAESENWKAFISRAIQTRARRHKINSLYENGNLCKDSMFYAYYGGSPQKMNTGSKYPLPRKPLADPLAPEDSFPDRIVECIWLPDARLRYVGKNTKDHTEVREEPVVGKPPGHLFLKRRLLTEPYHEDVSTYSCEDCGRRFLSIAGQRYHIQSNVCVQRNISEAEKRREREAKTEKGSQLLLQGEHVPVFKPSQPKSSKNQTQGDSRQGRKRIRKKKEIGMYPEVIISLGFKVIKEDMKFTDDMKLPKPIEIQSVPAPLSDDESVHGDLAVDKPEALLGHLKRQLVEHQRGADDQKHGSMYADVFRVLRYKKPRKKRKTKNENDIAVAKRRRRNVKPPPPPPPPKPLPPIIDTRALADEVDSGRYPTMNRYKGDSHDDQCILCRDGGQLICCDFCRSAEHMRCIRKKFTVKDPEPEDDFMCHKCIQFILQRRSRAEKRRLKKHELDETRRKEEELEESRRNPGIKKGMEYPYMAARGSDVSELIGLLQDAKIRLKQTLATAKMNNVRRKVLGCYYSQK